MDRIATNRRVLRKTIADAREAIDALQELIDACEDMLKLYNDIDAEQESRNSLSS